MTSNSLITDPEPLKTQHVPAELVNRENSKTALHNLLNDNNPQNIHLQGPRGTGKTHLSLTVLQRLPDDVRSCYVDCRSCQTQYQTLKQIYQAVTEEPINTGYHTSDLQRKIEERTTAVDTVIVLDEVDFLLSNDGNDLLYYLSRMENPCQTITISPQTQDLENQLEERTYSSLRPYPLQLEHYSGEEIYEILLQRARQALKPQSLQREALTLIASRTRNLKTGLHWLKAAAENADRVIKESTVRETKSDAHQRHNQQLLNRFTEHHQLSFQAIEELHTEQESDSVKAGDVYQRYQELTQTYDTDSLSNRRISTFLKHLELLDLIEAEYHYGGNKGKTREIKLKRTT